MQFAFASIIEHLEKQKVRFYYDIIVSHDYVLIT